MIDSYERRLSDSLYLLSKGNCWDALYVIYSQIIEDVIFDYSKKRAGNPLDIDM